jgi:homoserine O-acetyltransferase/O-succinyltransferase
MSTLQLAGSPREHILSLPYPLVFESGELLPQCQIAYQTWGKLNADRSNVVWVCHALTGNHRVHEWWGGLFGEGRLYDPADHFIVCVNVPSSCYGTSGPVSSGLYRRFPQTTIRDMVQCLEIVRKELNIEKISTLIGASLGGQQALEWTVANPSAIDSLVLIATNAYHSPFGIAFNEAQRLAISADPTFQENRPEGGRNGMIAARSVAMLSYRSYLGYALTQSESDTQKTDGFLASSYQRYQGEKLASRFDAFSYWYLSKAMDSHNVSRGRGKLAEVLGSIDLPVQVIGVDSDMLFPVSEQYFLADSIPGARLDVISSDFGHDGFLVEYDQLEAILGHFKSKNEKQAAGRQTELNHG